jgi:hypothetical protein
MQALPWLPHLAPVAVTHWLFSQQPEGHAAASQTQAPPTHA